MVESRVESTTFKSVEICLALIALSLALSLPFFPFTPSLIMFRVFKITCYRFASFVPDALYLAWLILIAEIWPWMQGDLDLRVLLGKWLDEAASIAVFSPSLSPDVIPIIRLESAVDPGLRTP